MTGNKANKYIYFGNNFNGDLCLEKTIFRKTPVYCAQNRQARADQVYKVCEEQEEPNFRGGQKFKVPL